MKVLFHMVLAFLLLICSSIFAQQQTLKLEFTPEEMESMLFLYNQTIVKGSDVEIVAPLGVKLRTGLNEARTMKDTTKILILQLTLAEVQICLYIIQQSTFEAKYASLILGMKRKIEAILPPELLQQSSQ